MPFNQKPQSQNSAKAETKLNVDYDIRVMPVKFHKYLTVAPSGGFAKWLIIIIIIIIVMAGLTFGAYYLISKMSKEPPAPQLNNNQDNSNVVNTDNVNDNANANDNQNDNANSNANENLNGNDNANTNINDNANSNANDNTNTNVNTNTSSEDQTVTYISSQDADSDNLTDTEEDLLTTEKRVEDTDNDGYKDGDEVKSLYNPKAANSLLITSGLINVYDNPLFNYKLYYPKGWLALSTDQSLKEVIFQSSTGEYVQVLIEENPDKLDLVDWYLLKNPGLDLQKLKRETQPNGYDMLISPNKLIYSIVDKNQPDKIYVLEYKVGDEKEVNFITIFAMMVNSFNLQAVAGQ